MQASERQLLAQEAARLGSALDDSQLERLSSYVEVLRAWNERVRLLGDRDPEALVRKHLPDCLALMPLLPEVGPVADIGSGAGLPGMVVSCVRVDLECWLVESRRRPVSFLSEVAGRLGLEKARVLHGRAEDVARRPDLVARAMVVTARAVSLEDLLRLGMPLMHPSGRLLAMQSQRESIDRTRMIARPYGVEILHVLEYQLMGGQQRRIVTLARR